MFSPWAPHACSTIYFNDLKSCNFEYEFLGTLGTKDSTSGSNKLRVKFWAVPILFYYMVYDECTWPGICEPILENYIWHTMFI